MATLLTEKVNLFKNFDRFLTLRLKHRANLITSFPMSSSKKRTRSEREKARKLEDNFEIKGSMGEKFIQDVLGYPSNVITKDSLIKVALVFSKKTGEHIPRDYYRTRKLIIKWFDMHCHKLKECAVDFHPEVELISPKGHNSSTND